MDDIVTTKLPSRRMRTVHFLRGGPDDALLIYDLERTFLIEVPDQIRPLFNQTELEGPIDSELPDWLLEVGLLTYACAPSWSDRSNSAVPTITDVSLDLPGACNMGCHYCFEKPINSRIGRMREETLLASINFAFNQAELSDHIALHFGSGEPLIEFDTLRRLVKETGARAAVTGQKLTYELTTNATLITPEIAAFLTEHPFNVRVSCDGPAEVHDTYRPMANGRASYPLVERGLKLLLEHLPDQLTVNTVLCAGTRLATVWDWANELGFRHFHVIKVGSDADAPQRLREIELSDFRADLLAICDDMLADLVKGRRPIDYQPITKIVRRLMIPSPITRFCGVAGSYVGIASDGDIYPCFRHLGLKNYKLGSVSEGIDDALRLNYLQNEAADVDTRPGCNTCWARYLCGGGCYADSVIYGSDKFCPKAEHCPFWRAEISEGIRFYHRLRIADPYYAMRLFGDDPDTFLGSIQDAPPSFIQAQKTF